MNPTTIAPTPRAAALLVLAILAALFLIGDGTSVASPGAATGSADVRLVRLLSELPDSMRARPDRRLHDLRVRLVTGNVLVFRKGGEFAALLPIETIAGNPDSLRYFFYVEKPAMFWIFAGARSKGILTVADGGVLEFNSFQLLWGKDDAGLGWIYFQDAPMNQRLRFSVVSGQSVDEVDPKDTKYWIELGAESEAGF